MSLRATPVERKDKLPIQKNAPVSKHLSAKRRCSVGDAFFVAIAAFVLLLLFIASGCRQSQSPRRSQGRKLVLLGFDGADPDLLQKWMSEGQLPHIQQLISQGGFRRLETTNPPESPVAWSSFATGMNPGKHGVFDFIQRKSQTYLPEIALARVSPPKFLFQWIPLERAKVTNHRRGTPFYQTLSEAGIKTTVLRMPLEFPPAQVANGKVLGGLSIPDVRGTWGTFFYFSTDLTRWETGSEEFGGKLVRLDLQQDSATTQVEGPENPIAKKGSRITVPFELQLNPERNGVKISVQGQEETVLEHSWSGWFHFRFAVNRFYSISAIARFHVIETVPELRVYLTPLNYDPEQPAVPISFPEGYSRQLAQSVGPFKTLGWAHDTWALNEERIDESIFLSDTLSTLERHAALLFHELKTDRADCTIAVFTATDSVAHMFYRYLDATHPRHDANQTSGFADAILRVYRKMDDIVAETQRLVGSSALIVLSDHGFHSFRKGFNTNTWLLENGFMTLKRDANVTASTLNYDSFLPNVDWTRTQAYALGLGQIYLNVKGRERDGILEAGSDALSSVRNRIVSGLKLYVDPDTGESVIQNVYRSEDIFKGDQAKDAADLQVAFRPGYRTSWETTLGAIPPGVVVANSKKWSGDHCASDPSDTQGIFLANRRLNFDKIAIVDLAPTILNYFGVSANPDLDGRRVPIQW